MATKLDPRTVRIASVVGVAVLAMVICFTLGRYTAPEANVVRLEFPKGGLFGGGQTESPKGKQAGSPPTKAGTPLRRGDIVAEIKSAEIGKPAYRSIYGGKEEQLENECLIIWYSFSNLSRNKRYHYTRFPPKLTDNFDNDYKQVDIHGSLEGVVRGNNPTIDPGESVADAAIFEKPFPNATSLTFVISGGQVHDHPETTVEDYNREGYRFLIPMSFVRRN